MGSERRRLKLSDPSVEKAFRALWGVGTSVEDIANLFDIVPGTVGVWRARLDLPKRKNRKKAVPESEPVASISKVAGGRKPLLCSSVPRYRGPSTCGRWSAGRDDTLTAKGGTHSKRAALADRWGLPLSAVTARWHLLRTSKAKRATV